MTTEIDTGSPLVRATLALRLLLELGLFTGIIGASILNFDGGVVWVAAIVGILFTAGVWGVFAVANDPSRSGKTVAPTPGSVRLVMELGLFAAVTAWLILGGGYIFGALLGGGVIVHYASWPARIRWLFAH